MSVKINKYSDFLDKFIINKSIKKYKKQIIYNIKALNKFSSLNLTIDLKNKNINEIQKRIKELFYYTHSYLLDYSLTKNLFDFINKMSDCNTKSFMCIITISSLNKETKKYLVYYLFYKSNILDLTTKLTFLKKLTRIFKKANKAQKNISKILYNLIKADFMFFY